jgi:hypothetical protein
MRSKGLTTKPISRRIFSLWLLVTALEGLIAAIFLAREPSEAGSAFVFGLSPERLLIVIGVLWLALLFVVVAVAHFYRYISWNESINKKPNSLRYVLAGVLILELVLLHLLFLIPDYYFPTLSAYLFRLGPVLIWFALIFAQAFVFLAYFGGLSLGNLMEWRQGKPAIIALAIIGTIWGLIAVTEIGIIPDDLYWNVAGVPLLTWQVWTGLGTVLIGWLLYNRFVLKKRYAQISSIAVFIGIWIIAAIVWVRTPLVAAFNAPGPYLPSKGFYPFVDAALFDLGAQTALYGRGLFWGLFFDRGLLMGFLAFIHKFFGQNYLMVVDVQSAIFAIFPALLYLLGKKLHSTSAGLMVATLAILKVSNSIVSGKLLSTSHPKLMLTEFPTGIILVLFSLFFVFWLRENNSKAHYLAGTGAVIGIGILLRTHVFFMFLVVILLGIVIWKLRWKRALRDILLVVVAFFITVSPWMWRNQRVAGKPLFFLQRFNSVIEERYQPQSHISQQRLFSSLPSRALEVRAAITRTESDTIFELYQFVPKHFVHNLITSVLILPPSPILDDLRHVVDDYPYWGRLTNFGPGQISGFMGIFLAINLFLLAIGLGAAWKRVGFIALVPLAVFLFYNLANAFARTSGGRYIVPVDWVVYFYYAIGLVEIVRFCISKIGFQTNDFWEGEFGCEQDKVRKLNWGKAGLVVLPFFLMATALPIIELASPGVGSPDTTDTLIQRLSEKKFFETSGFSQTEVREFLKKPEALLISGRGFYPRYYLHDQGEPILPGLITPYTAREFPRLVFTLLLPNAGKPVLLPIDNPRLKFPDAAEVIVGGCQVIQSPNDPLSAYLNYIDAAFVVILDEPGDVYIRAPKAPLTCPLRVPVCDNNHNCK